MHLFLVAEQIGCDGGRSGLCPTHPICPGFGGLPEELLSSDDEPSGASPVTVMACQIREKDGTGMVSFEVIKTTHLFISKG